MSTKPPPLFSRMESVRLYVTPKMLKVVAGALALLLLPASAVAILRPQAGSPQQGPSPLPIPAMEVTTDARGWSILRAVAGSMPSPGPNQKRAGQCRPERSEVEISGGCWVRTDHPRPCPEGYQWEHEGRCWLPVAHAKPVPRSGDVYPVNVAGEE